jgi:hypothetical protein
LAGSGASATGAGGGRAARSCMSRGEGGREAGWWAVQQARAQLAVVRKAMIGGPGPGKMIKKRRKENGNQIEFKIGN